MKTILIIFCLFSIACVTSGHKARSVASLACLDCDKGIILQDKWKTQVQQAKKAPASEKCTIDNYQDIVFQENAERTKCNLRHADLSYANLSDADLRRAKVREADLRCADLRRAKVREADLRGADLSYANLWRADLRFADLRYADLRYANLRGADLRGADLREAKVTCAQADNLEARDITGFNSPSWLACLFE